MSRVRITLVAEEDFDQRIRGLEQVVGIPVMVTPAGKLWPKPRDEHMTVKQEGEEWFVEWR